MSNNNLLIQMAGENRTISISREMIENAESVLAAMDRDMDNGWKLGKTFIPSPSSYERCQIVANRMLTGMHSGNQASVMLMAAYILSRLPGVQTVDLNTEGEAEETQFYDGNNCVMS